MCVNGMFHTRMHALYSVIILMWVLESDILCLPSFVYCSTGLASVLFSTRNSAWVESLVEWNYVGLPCPFFLPYPHVTEYSLHHSCSRVHALVCIFYVHGFLSPPPPRSTPVMSPGSCLFMCTSPFWRIPIVSDVIFLSSSLVIIHYSFIFT